MLVDCESCGLWMLMWMLWVDIAVVRYCCGSMKSQITGFV